MKKKDKDSYLIFRGGSWINGAHNCRSAIRGVYSVDSRRADLGFRVVLPKKRKR